MKAHLCALKKLLLTDERLERIHSSLDSWLSLGKEGHWSLSAFYGRWNVGIIHQSPFFPLAVPCGSSVNVSRWAWSALVSRGGAPRQWHTYGKPNHSTMGVGLKSLPSSLTTLRSLNYGCSFLLGTYHSKNQRQRWAGLMIHRNLLFPFRYQEEGSWFTFSLIWILWNRSRFGPTSFGAFWGKAGAGECWDSIASFWSSDRLSSVCLTDAFLLGVGVGGPSLSRGILSTGRLRTTTHWQKRWLAYDSDPAAPPLKGEWEKKSKGGETPGDIPQLWMDLGIPFTGLAMYGFDVRGLESHKGLRERCGQ